MHRCILEETILQIPSLTIMGFVCQNWHLGLGLESYWKPVQIPVSSQHMCCSILDQFRLPCCLQGQPHVDRITIITFQEWSDRRDGVSKGGLVHLAFLDLPAVE